MTYDPQKRGNRPRSNPNEPAPVDDLLDSAAETDEFDDLSADQIEIIEEVEITDTSRPALDPTKIIAGVAGAVSVLWFWRRRRRKRKAKKAAKKAAKAAKQTTQ